MEEIKEEKRRRTASRCRESFFRFVQEFWDVVSAEQPVWNWHIEYLCNHLQTVAELVFAGQPKTHDLIINVPPGTTKSTIASIMFPAWIWTRMESARCICGSYTFHLAMDLSRKSRDVVLSDKYRACFPGIALRDDQNTKSYFANDAGGIRYAVGVGGSVMGMHGHFLIVDDPIDPAQVLSDAEIKTANNWMAETLPTRKVDKAVTPLVLIMQRLHQNDPTGNRLAKLKAGPVRHICLPAELSEHVNPPELAANYRDGLLDPIRLPHAVLDEALATLGQFGYSGQFRQHPVPLGGGMFKTSKIVIEQPPPIARFKAFVRSWDKAGTAGGGAFTVGSLLGLDGAGHFWILDVVRGQWSTDEREARILQTAQADGRDVTIVLEQEPGSGGKESAERSARMLAGYRVRLDRPVGDKELRADPFSVQVNTGNVSMKPGPWNADCLQELQYFPASTYKDQVDSLAMGFANLTAPRARGGAIV